MEARLPGTNPLPKAVIDRLTAVVGKGNCITEETELRTYESDGLTSFRAMAGAVVLPNSTEQVAAVVRIARAALLPIVPRGAGTGLSGGALPIPGSIVVALSRMKRLLEVDLETCHRLPVGRAVRNPDRANARRGGTSVPTALGRPTLSRPGVYTLSLSAQTTGAAISTAPLSLEWSSVAGASHWNPRADVGSDGSARSADASYSSLVGEPAAAPSDAGQGDKARHRRSAHWMRSERVLRRRERRDSASPFRGRLRGAGTLGSAVLRSVVAPRGSRSRSQGLHASTD